MGIVYPPYVDFVQSGERLGGRGCFCILGAQLLICSHDSHDSHVKFRGYIPRLWGGYMRFAAIDAQDLGMCFQRWDQKPSAAKEGAFCKSRSKKMHFQPARAS